MKTLLLLLVSVLLTSFASATGIRLSWDASPPDPEVLRYIVTCDTGAGTTATTVVVEAPLCQVEIHNLEHGTTYRFRVQAANDLDTSAYSAPLVCDIPNIPSAPTGLKIELLAEP